MLTAVTCTAFVDFRRVASGDVAEVAVAVKSFIERDPNSTVLVFDDTTSELVELDLRGNAKDVLDRVNASRNAAVAPSNHSPRTPGRPKLGVVAREVTLLPRHWDWLRDQPGGASVALRKLVDDARRHNGHHDRVRRAREVTYRFMSAIAGNLAGYEEATRALFAGDRARFDTYLSSWPADVREHATLLARCTFEPSSP